MANLDVNIEQQPVGIVGPQASPAAPAPYDPLGAAVQVADVGLSLFSANYKNQKNQELQAADDLEAQQGADASSAAATYIKAVQQRNATKGGLAAQTYAAKEFAKIQASLPAGTREMFVDNVKKGLGFNPIDKSLSYQVSEEQAQEKVERENKQTAQTILLASVNMNDPDSVRTAYAQAENMSPEQVNYIMRVSEAEDLRVQKEVAKHNLTQERYQTADVRRTRAERVAVTAMDSTVNKLTAGYEVRLQTAIAGGDVNEILRVQKEGLEKINMIKTSIQSETVSMLQQGGIQDVNTANVGTLLNPVMTKLNNLERVLNMTDLQNATDSTINYMFSKSLVDTSNDKTIKGKVASAILFDKQFGTAFSETYQKKLIATDIIQGALSYNNAPTREQEGGDASDILNKAVLDGSVSSLIEMDGTTPNLAELATDLTKAQVEGLKVGVDKPDTHETLAKGVLNNWNAAAYGESPLAIRSKVYEPVLEFFANKQNATAYAPSLAGSQDVFLKASSEYIRSNVMPSLSQAIGMTNNDLRGKFNVEIQGGKFQLTAKEVSGTDAPYNVGIAARTNNTQRTVVANAARRTEALYNKIILAYSNLYGVDLGVATSVFAQSYADALGVQLIEIEEDGQDAS